MKHLKKFERLSTAAVNEDANSKQLDKQLLALITSAQHCLEAYSDKEGVETMLKALESTIESAQLYLNFIERDYGPIESIQNTTRETLQRCYDDLQHYSNYDIVNECVQLLQQALRQLR